MRKITVALLSIFAYGALGLSGAAAFCAQNTTVANAAPAETETTLLAPATYEEYLHLSTPSDVAVTENYTAIADGNTIYVYDRKDGEYLQYVHEFNKLDPLKNNVTKLQFDNQSNLYFLDATYLYVLNPKTLDEENVSVKETQFPCSNFYLHENTLYYTDAKTKAQLSKIDLNNTEINVNNAVTLESGLSGKPTVTVFDGELYYTSGRELWKMNPDDKTPVYVAAFPHLSEIVSMSIQDNVFLCTDDEANFYAYNLPDLVYSSNADKVTPIATDAGGYSSLAAYGEYVYAVKNNAVRQYSLSDAAFTDFEICNRSASAHRLNGGSETCLAGNTLLIADNGNERISVYNTANGQFQTPIVSKIYAKYLAADEETVLAANETEAVLYSLTADTYGQQIAVFDDFKGVLSGATNVYGKYYFTSESYCHYVAQPSETGEWTLTETERAPKRTANLLTSDAYGYLYVASGNRVERYTEAQFLSASEAGEELSYTLPALTTKILVDYQGNLYALTDGKIQKVGDETAVAVNTPLVYTDTAAVQSFAFGIENNTTYLLYKENYLAETSLLALPTVKTIPVNNADESIFAAESATFTVVQTKPDALAVTFDVKQLQGATVFPYLSFARHTQSFTALKIGATETYNVLAVYDEQTDKYNTCLVLKSQCTELPTNEYRTDYETEKIGYLTNPVSLYKFPYLTSLLTVCRLQQGKQVTLLGEIDKLDHTYYHIAYEDENGIMQTGYIPKAYVTSFNGATPQTENVVYGSTADNDDAVWRLAYLILGTGAICILIDILLLRKRPKED